MTRFLLVRHPSTSWNSERRYAGWSDVPLDKQGQKQIEMLAGHLAHEPLVAVFSSDLQRCLQAASAIAARHRLVVRTEAALRESNFGDWEGRSYAELRQVAPRELDAWAADPLQNAPPGGETLTQLAERVWACLDRIEQEIAMGSVLVVTHGGAIRVALCRWLGMPLMYHWRLRIDPASLSIIDTYPEGAIANVVNESVSSGT